MSPFFPVVGIVQGGTFRPGNSIGTLNVEGNVDLDGGVLAIELGAPGVNDLLAITETLELGNSALSLAGGVLDETYTIATFSQRIGEFSSVSPNYIVDHGENAITVTVIPEPGSVALLALGGLALLRRKR